MSSDSDPAGQLRAEAVRQTHTHTHTGRETERQHKSSVHRILLLCVCEPGSSLCDSLCSQLSAHSPSHSPLNAQLSTCLRRLDRCRSVGVLAWWGVRDSGWGGSGAGRDTCRRSSYNVTAVCVALLTAAFKFTFQARLESARLHGD